MTAEQWKDKTFILRLDLEDWQAHIRRAQRMLGALAANPPHEFPIEVSGSESPDDDGLANTPDAGGQIKPYLIDWTAKRLSVNTDWCSDMIAGLDWYANAFDKDQSDKYDKKANEFLLTVQNAYLQARQS